MKYKSQKRRALGQHFLRDNTVIHQIVDHSLSEAQRLGCETILEIGCGDGALSIPMSQKIPSTMRYVIVETDQDLVMRMDNRPESSRFELIKADFLELPVNDWQTRTPVYVMSNLPYSSATAILQRLAHCREQVPGMTLMFQAEVAKKLRAKIEKKDMSSLGLWIQNHWDVEKLCEAPPQCFAPPPEVNSEVVTLSRRSKPHLTSSPEADQKWQSLLKVSFAHKRKMLRGCLKVSPQWQNTLELSGVDGTKRAEALSWDEWKKLLDAALQT